MVQSEGVKITFEAWDGELLLLRQLRRQCDAYFIFPDIVHAKGIHDTLVLLHEREIAAHDRPGNA